MPTPASSFEDVQNDELQEIRKRRNASGMWDRERSKSVSDDTLRRDLTGLALSGGGVRSAAICLGLLQSFYKAGRMKFVDYLSTVSGGGYAGALYSSEVATDKDGVNWEREGKSNRLSIESPSSEGQPRKVYQLSLHGRQFSNVLTFLSRHLFGWVITTSLLLSVLTMIGALLAWVMRLPWTETGMVLMPNLGFMTDISKAFFPAFLSFFLWIFMLAVHKSGAVFGVKFPPLHKVTYVLLLTTVILGVITLVSSDKLGISNLASSWDLSDNVEHTINQLTDYVSLIFGVVFFAVMVPYLAPSKLLASGAAKESTAHKALFNFAGYGLLFGLPIVVFYVLSHEDFADKHADRIERGVLHQSNLREFRSLAVYLKANPSPPVHESLLQAIEDVVSESSSNRNELIDKWILDQDAHANSVRTLGFVDYWIDFVASKSIYHGEGEFALRRDRIKRLIEGKEFFAKAITEQCLTDPYLFDLDKGQMPINKADNSTNQVAEWGLMESLRMGQFFMNGPPETQTRELSVTDAVRIKRWFHGVGSKEVDKNELSVEKATRAFEQLSNLKDEFSQLVTDLKETDKEASSMPTQLKQNVPELFNGNPTKGPQNCGIILTKLLKEIENANEKMEVSDDSNKQQQRRWLLTHQERVRRLVYSIRAQNWLLLRCRFVKDQYFSSPKTIYAGHVTFYDQQARLNWFWYGFGVFVVIGLLANLNNTCLHGFYRDQLASIWLRDPGLKLKDLSTCDAGGQLHLINCTLNHMSGPADPDPEQRSRFVASSRFCGSKLTGYRPTDLYMNGETTIADAMAISGAAVSTAMPFNVLYRVIMTLTNFRLGQWWRNPSQYREEHYWPSPIRAMSSLAWNPEERPYCFLTDGGHLDNTGVSALLERRCRLIVLIDASEDPKFDFQDVRKLLQAARGKYHIEFEPVEISGTEEREQDTPAVEVFDRIRPQEGGLSKEHFIALKVKYPTVENIPDGLLIIGKSSLTGDEPIDLVALATRGAEFPHDPTSNQFLHPERFENYVLLGRHIGNEIGSFLDSQRLLEDPNNGSPTTDLGGPCNPMADANASSNAYFAHVGALFDSNPHFDSKNLLLMTSTLMQWAESNSQDTRIVEQMALWAIHYADSAPTSLKRRLCVNLVELTSQYAEKIRSLPPVKFAIGDLLQSFKVSGVKGINGALTAIHSSESVRQGDTLESGVES